MTERLTAEATSTTRSWTAVDVPASAIGHFTLLESRWHGTGQGSNRGSLPGVHPLDLANREPLSPGVGPLDLDGFEVALVDRDYYAELLASPHHRPNLRHGEILRLRPVGSDPSVAGFLALWFQYACGRERASFAYLHAGHRRLLTNLLTNWSDPGRPSEYTGAHWSRKRRDFQTA